ncbi:hypothetical protein MTBLM1_40311 [Rhodospirillaceae bacterium LM-1]|nr:hypothetical protein MTBLM1_40311 [Rhodospirillaceae bacterium LM-1]
MRWTLPQAEGKLGALQRALGNLLIFAKFAAYAAGWAILSWDMFIAPRNTSSSVGWITTLFSIYLILSWLASSACSILHRFLIGPVPEKWKMLSRGVGLSMLMFWLSVNFRSFNFRECDLPTCENWWTLLFKPLF